MLVEASLPIMALKPSPRSSEWVFHCSDTGQRCVLQALHVVLCCPLSEALRHPVHFAMGCFSLSLCSLPLWDSACVLQGRKAPVGLTRIGTSACCLVLSLILATLPFKVPFSSRAAQPERLRSGWAIYFLGPCKAEMRGSSFKNH